MDLKRSGAILLVSTYELGHQPLAIASPTAFLRRAGYDPATLDCSIEGFVEERFGKASFVGISVPMHTALRLGIEVGKRVRAANPRAHICFYGIYATLNAEYLLDGVADSVIGGEYEEPLVQLVTRLEKQLDYRHQSDSRQSSPYLHRIPFEVPAREGLPPLSVYSKLRHRGQEVPAGYVETTRGCKHLCLHCPIPPVYKGRFFVVPQAVVLEDVGRLVAAGAEHITFGDPDFLNAPTHSVRITRELHERFPELTFDFTAKVEHIIKHRDLIPELSRKGCVFVVSALESLSDEVLEKLRKGHSRRDIANALGVLRKNKIALRPSFVPFTPWTSVGDYLQILDFVESRELVESVDPIQYAIRLLIPPGSSLLSSPDLKPFLREFVPDELTHRWAHPDPMMESLHKTVLRIVEQQGGEDVFSIFNRIKEVAHSAGGGYGLNESPSRRRLREEPRLTEPWFC